MFDFNRNHKTLVLTAFGVFLALSLGVAVYPAYQMENYTPIPDQPKMTDEELAGEHVFISEGCVACHTQQVRNIEMDKTWGGRPSVPEDYYYSKQRMDVWRQTPSILGSERTGPDLTDVGERQSGAAWQLLHLYDPRAVVEASIMPGFRWLFREVDSAAVDTSDVIVAVPKDIFDKPGKKIIATKDALNLVAYLQSLRQFKLPEGSEPEFIPFAEEDVQDQKLDEASTTTSLDGEKLFMNTCAACHQKTGKGVPGAFPPLEGSEIVNAQDPTKMISIILQGYNELKGYGPMPAFGDQLTDAEIAAIMTHERSSWGNNAPAVKVEEVKKVRDSIMKDPS